MAYEDVQRDGHLQIAAFESDIVDDKTIASKTTEAPDASHWAGPTTSNLQLFTTTLTPPW